MITKKRVVTLIGIVLCIMLCIPGIYWYQSYKHNLSETESNLYQDTSVDTEFDAPDISETQNTESDKDNTDLNLNEAYDKAETLGKRALELEQKYIENIWTIEYDSEHWEEASDENLEISKELQELFTDSVPISQIWYLGNPNQDISFIWSFQAGLNYANGQIPVNWTCKTENGEILAVLMAQYDIESEVFWNSKLYQTYTGERYAAYETQDESEEDEEAILNNQFISGVKSIANAINEYIEQTPVEPGEIPYKYEDDMSEDEE